MPNYVTSDGTPFTTSWTTAQVVQYLTSRGVSQAVAQQEATTDLLRYGDDLPRVLDSMIAHLLERSDNAVKAGTGTQSTQPNNPQPSASNGGSFAPAPPAVASVVTTMGAAPPASMTPTVGPIGLAYPDDPVNYSTMEVGSEHGYSSGGILPSGIYPSGGMGAAAPGGGGAAIVGGGDNTMVYLLLAGAAVAAYFLLK